jgi:hypothetical protein
MLFDVIPGSDTALVNQLACLEGELELILP